MRLRRRYRSCRGPARWPTAWCASPPARRPRWTWGRRSGAPRGRAAGHRQHRLQPGPHGARLHRLCGPHRAGAGQGRRHRARGADALHGECARHRAGRIGAGIDRRHAALGHRDPAPRAGAGGRQQHRAEGIPAEPVGPAGGRCGVPRSAQDAAAVRPGRGRHPAHRARPRHRCRDAGQEPDRRPRRRAVRPAGAADPARCVARAGHGVGRAHALDGGQRARVGFRTTRWASR